MTIDFGESHALDLDAADPLAPFRQRFYLNDQIYLDGNSLGLLSVDAELSIISALDQWKQLGISGWLGADPPWFTYGEDLGALMAPLFGAGADEVVVSGTTTVNLHNLVSTFYRPEGERRKIIATELDFPSDIYALQSQILLKNGDPDRDLIRIGSRDGRLVEESDIITAIDQSTALVLLPSVLYRSGQLLDISRLTAAAHNCGALIGFDCAHSAGSVPHHLDRWGVDFAFWCTYKYLNAGPGATGALYVNRKHFGQRPGLAGWWGYRKQRQFDMLHEWEGAANAGEWQISTPSILGTAALFGSLAIFQEAGIEAIRNKSLALTGYLADLIVGSGLTETPYSYRIGTPLDPVRSGGHLAVEHHAGFRLATALKQRGIIPDFRPPDVVRLAPVALYTSFHDLWRTVQQLRAIIDEGDLDRLEGDRALVS